MERGANERNGEGANGWCGETRREALAEPEPWCRLDTKFRIGLSFAYLGYHNSSWNLATRCTAARQLFDLSYCKAGRLQRFARPLRKIRSLAPPTLGPAPPTLS
jgi:hypothetical protein